MPAAAAPAEPVRAQGFFCSSLCFWKIVVLVSGCAAFALYASSELYAFGGDVKKYVLAAYIISWAISLLIFFARITGKFVKVLCFVIVHEFGAVHFFRKLFLR